MLMRSLPWLNILLLSACLAQVVQAQSTAATKVETPLAQAKSQAQAQAAMRAFLSWEKGESTGNYADFKAALSSEFDLFSHPVQPARGVAKGAKAKDLMLQLIEQRTTAPNQLKFANVVQHAAPNSYLFEFDSEGKVSGYPYKGWNVIQLTIGPDNKVTGFREYLGDVDPAWFQKR